MGASFISFSVVLPTDKTKAFVASERKRIKAVLAKLDLKALKDTPSAEEDTGGDGKTPWMKVVDATGVDGPEYENDLGECELDSLLVKIDEDLATLVGFDEDSHLEESGGMTAVIGGHRVTFSCAGEMSWGDRPEGAAFEAFGALHRLGIQRKMLDLLKEPARK